MGHEMRKTRPCLVISPNELNRSGRPVIVAPLTTAVRRYTSRVPSDFGGRPGFIALDQLRAVDQSRLGRRLGRLDADTGLECLATLRDMFEA